MYKTMMIYQSRYDEQGVNVTVWNHTAGKQTIYGNVSESTQGRLELIARRYKARLAIANSGLTVFFNNG